MPESLPPRGKKLKVENIMKDEKENKTEKPSQPERSILEVQQNTVDETIKLL